jgi:hypothetical protein
MSLPFNDREVERVLAGQQPYARPELAEVAYFVARLRALVDFERTPPMSPELRAQLEATEAAQLRRARSHRKSVVGSLDGGDTAGPHELQLVRLDQRRDRKRARLQRRWRAIAAAAAIVTLGGVLAVGLQGGSRTPPVETDPGAERDAQSTTTVGAPAETRAEPPAASPSDESSRPDVPAEPPASQVETSTPTTAEPVPTTDGSPPNALPPGMEEEWPPECPQGDWRCFCEHYAGDYRRMCDDMDDYPHETPP